MRDDQRERLEGLTEKLAEVVLMEADPDEWPGAHVPMAAWSQQERGDRYWCKRNAAATLGLLERLQRTLTDQATAEGAKAEQRQADDELDREINEAERRAAKLLAKVKATASSAGRGA